MADWVGWVGICGTLGTFGFGALSVKWGLRDWRDRAVRDAHRMHLEAVKKQMDQIRGMCSEAINTGEVIETPGARQWVRQLAQTLVGIEGHLDAALSQEARPHQLESRRDLKSLPPSLE